MSFIPIQAVFNLNPVVSPRVEQFVFCLHGRREVRCNFPCLFNYSPLKERVEGGMLPHLHRCHYSADQSVDLLF